MKLTSPSYWKSRHNPISLLFFPISVLYQLGSKIRKLFSVPYRAKIPVVCVGNLTVGGGGKTPLVMTLAEKLSQNGVNVHVTTRGYGGYLLGPVLVEPDKHVSAEVGDEPLLLARLVPTWVAKNRTSGIKAAEEAGADLVLLDDGLQNPTFKKDFKIVCLNEYYKFGNKRVFPAGPLRETLSEGFKDVKAICYYGDETKWLKRYSSEIPIHICHHQMDEKLLSSLKKTSLIAFSGIETPDKFFEFLRESNLDVIEKKAFPDHYEYTEDDVKELLQMASDKGARLVTTLKDWIRLDSENRQKITPVMTNIACDSMDSLVKEIMDLRHHA